MAKHPSPRADQLRAMREAKFGRSSLAVSNDNQRDDDQPAAKNPLGRKKPLVRKKPLKKG
jgi:hypothetical protein